MAATVVLSSSPCYSAIAVTPPHGKPAAMSSSPSLPSPSQLFSSMPLRLPSGTKTAAIPSDAVAGFASASTLLRKAHEDSKVQSRTDTRDSTLKRVIDLHKTPSLIAEATKKKGLNEKSAKEKVVKRKAVDGNGVKVKKPVFQKPGLEQDHETILDRTNKSEAEPECYPQALKDNRTGVKKSSKKKKKDEDDGQTKIKQARVTKPRASGSSEKSKKTTTDTRKAKETVTSASMVPISTQDSDVQAREEFRELCSEKAIPMRRDWTPVRDTVQETATANDFENSGSALLPNTPSISELPKARFGELLGDFGLAQQGEDIASIFEAARPANGAAIVKRRRIELVKGMPAPAAVEKAQRSKSPKKLQTVTAKATAPFMPIDSPENSSLLQYFGATEVDSKLLTNGQLSKSGSPVPVMAKPPTKKTSKAKSAAAKVKKSTQAALLSPESAMKTAQDQELIFGTSSQLAREESPSLLKDIQHAMKESECNEGDWEPSQPSIKFKPYNSLALAQSRNLWSEASRDLAGSLLDTEVVDLSETPKPQRATAQLPLETQQGAGDSILPGGQIPSTVAKLDLESTSALQQQPQELEQVMPRSVAEAALKKRPKSHSPTKKGAIAKPAPDQMPNYKGFTDVQLSKAVTAYGFKTIKKREAMIVLLEKCWESKVAMALQEVPANTSQPQVASVDLDERSSKANNAAKKRGRRTKVSDATFATSNKVDEPPVKKPRGRPRKDVTATTPPAKRKPKAASRTQDGAESAVLALDEIYDSSPPTPSPPRRRSPPKSPAPLPLSPSTITATTLTETPAINDQALLFESVTKAVTTFPPSHDPKNLTFYEKMLMYEPVVLEDLTIWLNAEGLGKVGEDNEVSLLQVKEWCESKSICCLWKENLRGGARARW
ncbi:hypothetical protein P7C71_g1588, partial [Lecanoromycetidae sp. Uapishka_2]